MDTIGYDMDSIIIFVILFFLILISLNDTRKHYGGVHVKPKSNTPKPKVSPAPQAGAKLKKSKKGDNARR